MAEGAIDIHTHIVPSEFPRYTGQHGETRWPHTTSCDVSTHKNVIIAGKNYRRVHYSCWDTAKRLEDMQTERVARQVLSPMPELLSYWFHVDDGISMSHYVNDILSEMVAASPGHFSAFGMVPLQHPDTAAKEVEQLARAGFSGIEIGSNVNGTAVGDPRFHPFFQAASENNMAVFIHSLHTVGMDRIVGSHPLLPTFIAFPSEIGFAAASLVTGGTLDRYPTLRIACSHGGGLFPVTLFRLRHGIEALAEQGQTLLKRPVEEYARMLYYDTVVYDHRLLEYLIKVVGIDRIMIGSDYPFIMCESFPGRKVGELDIDEAAKNKILRENAIRFLNLQEELSSS